MAASLVLAGGAAVAATTISCPNRDGNLCLGSSEADTMIGTPRGDDMRGLGGNDALLARAGNDRLDGGTGDDELKGAKGNDSYGFARNWGEDTLGDASGVDTLDFSTLDLAVVVNLTASTDDEVRSDANTVNWPSRVVVEKIRGSSGGDRVEGNDAGNLLRGSSGGDDLSGAGGKDVLRGNTHVDFLRGGPGADRLEGGAAGDSYIFEDGWGTDTVSDGSGFNALDFTFSTTPVEVDLILRPSIPEARSGTNTVDLVATTVIGQVNGGFAGDTIFGGGAENALEGGEGDDTVNGRAGADGVGGGSGDDTLTGGPGPDIIGARKGDDIIRAADGEADVITCGDGFDTAYYDPGLDEDLSKCDKLIPRN